MTLLADRAVSAVVRVVVAAVTGNEHSTDVVARRTTQSRRPVGIALTTVCVTWTVEPVVVATVACHRRSCSGSVAGVDGRTEVSADVVACCSGH